MMQYIGTLGPACANEQVLTGMLQAGMTGLRINLSHGGLESRAEWLDVFMRTRERTGLPCGLIMDLQGRELRSGNEQPVELPEDSVVVLGEDIPVPSALLSALKPDAEISLDDSRMLLRVISGARCRVVRGGTLMPRKSMALLGTDVRLPPLTESDYENLKLAKQYGVTAVMQSFVRNAQDVEELRDALRNAEASELKVLTKIEDITGVAQAALIAEKADAVVVARGDLGNGRPLWEVPALQKRIAAACRRAGTPFWIGTQLLTSMEQSEVPTRAEMNDVFSSVLDGATGLILTGETAVGCDPAGAIVYLRRAAEAAKQYMEETV